jgi:glutathione synthase/RimK-type ligase-like ATP-grasp enzyme
MNNEIALVTCKELPELVDGERLILDPLIHAGFTPKEIPWDSENVKWDQFDAVVLRSSWDYHTRTELFKQWLNILKTNGTNLCNRIPTVSWNMDKHYLRDLAKRGVDIIPTAYIDQGKPYNLLKILSAFNQPSVIAKPTFGASAYRVAKIERTNLEEIERQIQMLLQQGDVMIQPFMEEVMGEGEYSLIFFGSKFSHAVIKKPAPTDFRTQPHFGGTEYATNADQGLVGQAQKILGLIPEPLLYARVDGVNIGGKLLLMELELIEPYLFFEQDDQAANKFVSVLLNYLSTKG